MLTSSKLVEPRGSTLARRFNKFSLFSSVAGIKKLSEVSTSACLALFGHEIRIQGRGEGWRCVVFPGGWRLYIAGDRQERSRGAKGDMEIKEPPSTGKWRSKADIYTRYRRRRHPFHENTRQ